jgi:hypothetical protein
MRIPGGTPVGQSGIERLRATFTAAVMSGYAALPMQSTPLRITAEWTKSAEAGRPAVLALARAQKLGGLHHHYSWI